MAKGEEVEILPPAKERGLGAVTFSPDGNYVYYAEYTSTSPRGTIYRVATLGGATRKIVDGAWACIPSPDGTHLAIASSDPVETTHTIILQGPEGQDRKDLVVRTGEDHFDTAPAWSPDGARIAIVSHQYGEDQKTMKYYR